MKLSLFALLALLAVVVVHAANPPVDANGDNIRMNAYAQLQYVSITKINGVEQSFASDFYMLTTWQAPMHDPAVTVDDDLNALQNLYWQPQLDFINAIGGINPLVDAPLSFVNQSGLSFDPSAPPFNDPLRPGYIWCQCDQRYVGEFLTPVAMQDFPYDTQTALLLIESFWDTTQVQILFAQQDHINLDHLFPSTMPDILGWKALRAENENKDILYMYNGRTYNRLILAIILNRQPEFFLNKLVAGCVMLVAMCICLFFLTAEEADRLMGSLAIFAGLIAYLFVAALYTPSLPYSTALDKFLLLCFVQVVLMSGAHATMFYYRERQKLAEDRESVEKMAAAETVDEDDGELEADEGGEEHAASKPQQVDANGTPVQPLPPGSVNDSTYVQVHPAHGSKVGDSSNIEMQRPGTANGVHSSRAHSVHPHNQPQAPSTASANAPAAGGRMNKRGRKRARKAAATQQMVARAQHNPILTFILNLGCTPIRFIDLILGVLFTFSFIIATAVIFGVPENRQRNA